ncbi:MAG: glycosyltransferase [Patescibacteria group bacterium]
MKIGIFTNNYLPNPYGVPGSVESFRKEFEKMGHEVFIFAPRWPGYVDKNENVFRYPAWDLKIKIRFPLAIPYSRRIDKVLEALDLDIIHSQHPNLLGGVARKWAWEKKIPLVFTWHTLYDRYANFVPFLPSGLVAWWTIRNARTYANLADQVIVPTDSIIPILKKWGVKRDMLAISTGVEEEVFQSADGFKVRKDLGLSNEDVVFLLVSRLTEEKNVEFIFDSLRNILKEEKRAKFLIVGGGYLLPKLETWVRENDLEGKIFFSGEVERERVKDYYAAADVFVYSSLSETQGMIVTEAMYMGLPIVAVQATGVSSLVEDGENGFLVGEDISEFSDKCQRLIQDLDLRRRMSKESSRLAKEKYTASVCARKMLEVYQKLTVKKKK